MAKERVPGTTVVSSRATYPCGCIVEVEMERDNITLEVVSTKPSQFLLMSHVCRFHEHLKSKEKGPLHEEKSNHALDIIEKAKQDNIRDWEETLTRARTPMDVQDVIAQRPGIEAHNARITAEWQWLTGQAHAHDKHIHDTILEEHRQGKWQTPVS